METVDGITRFVAEIDAKVAGVWSCAVRIIPSNPLLANDMELNLVKWAN